MTGRGGYGPERPLLLLVEPDLRARLRVSALLAGSFAVIHARMDAREVAEEPLRVARLRQPELALISLSVLEPEAGLRLCRMLKTDLAPVRGVGVRLRGAAPPAEEIAGVWRADGILAAGDDQVLPFVEALSRGEQPRIGSPPPGAGVLLRLLRRMRR